MLIEPLIVAFLCFRKGSPGKPRHEFIAMFDYTASVSDEIDLRKGDRVIVTEQHEDGWAQGKNLRTRKVRWKEFLFFCIPSAVDVRKCIEW